MSAIARTTQNIIKKQYTETLKLLPVIRLCFLKCSTYPKKFKFKLHYELLRRGI